MIWPTAAPFTDELLQSTASELLTLDYSPLLEELEETHSSMPTIFPLTMIDGVFKSTKGEGINLKQKSSQLARRLMPPPPPRKRAIKKVKHEALVVPLIRVGDELGLSLFCLDDHAFLFEE